MLEIKEAPELEGKPGETYWPGDPAVDAEASDLVAWARSGGDVSHLVLRDDMTPSLIRFRRLERRAANAVRAEFASANVNAFAEAFRHGLVEIEGVKVRRARVGGLYVLTDRSLDHLARAVAQLPSTELGGPVFERLGLGAVESKPTQLEEWSLPEGIGALVCLASFPLRG